MDACKYFGVRTSERERGVECQKCKEANLKLFKECTMETNILMGTSITVDEKGKTVSIPPKVVSDSELLYEKFEDSSPKTEENVDEEE